MEVKKEVKKNNLEKKNNTKTKKIDNKVLIIGAAVIVIVIILVGFLLFGGSKNDKKEKDNGNVMEEPEVSENDLKDAYGMSKEDAINLVKNNFNGDNFEFSAEINENNMYTVTIKNTLTGTIYKYEVDPIEKSYYDLDTVEAK